MKNTTYIHERSDWTKWQCLDKELLPLVNRVRILEGRLIGKLSTLDFDLNLEASTAHRTYTQHAMSKYSTLKMGLETK